MDSLTKSIGELLLDTKYADLEIQCGGKRFLVHRAIVCKRSKVIERECDGRYKESWTRVIKHEIYDFRAVDRMLQFIYGSDYKLDPVTPWKLESDLFTSSRHTATRDDNEDPLIAHIYVYAIADYYEVPELKTLATERFAEAKEKVESMTMDKILEIATVMYEHTSIEASKLRTEMMDLCHRNNKVTINSKDFMRTIARRSDLLEFRGDFMESMVERLTQQNKDDTASYEAAVKSVTDDFETTTARYERGIVTANQEKRDMEAAHAKEKNDLQDEHAKKIKDMEAAHAKEKTDLQDTHAKKIKDMELAHAKHGADCLLTRFKEKEKIKAEHKARLQMKDTELREAQAELREAQAELREAQAAYSQTKRNRDAANGQIDSLIELTRLKECPHCSTDLKLLPFVLEYGHEQRCFSGCFSASCLNCEKDIVVKS